MTSAPVVRSAWVNRSQADAFRIFTDEIGAWWPLPTHGLFGPKAGAVHFRDRTLVEQAADGTETVWAEVLAWEPTSRIVLSWHPGGGEASEVEVAFEAHEGGTRVVIEHRGWEAFGEEAMAKRHTYVGPNAWGTVLDHFCDGAEPRPDAIDTAQLEKAYEAFYDEAESGGFGAPDEGEWNAEQVVAHVALNDVAMMAVSHSLLHREPMPFVNEVGQDPEVLAGWIEACGDMDGLIARGRAIADQAVAVVQRLSPDQRNTPVDCRFVSDGEVVLENPMPWATVAVEIQATRHLTGHTEQLRELR